MNQIDFEVFLRIDIRVSNVVKVETSERAKNPSFKILVVIVGPDKDVHNGNQLH
jgi:hypothetical protein